MIGYGTIHAILHVIEYDVTICNDMICDGMVCYAMRCFALPRLGWTGLGYNTLGYVMACYCTHHAMPFLGFMLRML